MGTHPIFESDFDCLTEMGHREVAEENDAKIKVHPLVIMNISQHFSRIRAQLSSEEGPARTFTVKGALIGVMEPQLEICDTFEVPSDVTDPVSFMDLEFMIAKMEHLNEVTDQEIVGWYTTSNHSVSQHDLTQSKMVDTKCGDTRMLMMKVDPFNDTAPAVVYEFLETENCLEQREFCMETQDEERIGMDRILGDGLSDRSMSAAERVLEKVKILRNYLEAVASGELEGDIDLIRQAESILSHPPYALPEIMDKHEDDAYMIRTLTDVTLSSQSLHQYVQMDNGLIKRGGTGQVSGKWRGQKIVYNEHL